MTRRIAFLRDLHDIVSNITSSEVYLSEKHFDRIDDTTLFKRRTLFPEQKRAVSLARTDRVSYVTQEDSPRQGLPRWTAAGAIPVFDIPEGDSGRMLDPPNSQVLQMSAQMHSAGIDELSNQLYACERELREQDREKQERERVKAEKREQLAVAQAAFNSLHDPYQAAEEKRREEMLQDTANRRARLERELELKQEGKKHTEQVIKSMTGQSHGPEATSRWRTPW